MSNVKRTIILVVGLAVILAACIFAVSAVHKYSQHNKLEAIVKEMNKMCPERVDEATTLRTVELQGDTVVLTYDVSSDSLGFALKDFSSAEMKKAQILQQKCKALFISKEQSIYSDGAKDAISYGVSFEIIYRDEADQSHYVSFTISNEELKQLHQDFRKLDREKVAHEYMEYACSEEAPGNKEAIEEAEQQGTKFSFRYANNTVTIDYVYTAKFAQILKEQEPSVAYISNAVLLDALLDEIDIDEAKRDFAVSFPDKIFVSCARAAFTQFIINFRSALSDKKVSFTMSANELTMNVPGTNTYQFSEQ